MIDPRRGFIYETQDIPRGGMVQAVDFSTGILGFTDKYYFGAAVHHLNEPNESLVVAPAADEYTLRRASIAAFRDRCGVHHFTKRILPPTSEFQQLNRDCINKAHSSVAFGTVASCSRITATPSSSRWE